MHGPSEVNRRAQYPHDSQKNQNVQLERVQRPPAVAGMVIQLTTASVSTYFEHIIPSGLTRSSIAVVFRPIMKICVQYDNRIVRARSDMMLTVCLEPNA